MTWLAILTLLLAGCGRPAYDPQQPQDRLPELSACGSRMCWSGETLSRLDLEFAKTHLPQIRGFESADLTPAWTAGGRTFGWRSGRGRHFYLTMQGAQAVALTQSVAGIMSLDDALAQLGKPSQVSVRIVPVPDRYYAQADLFYVDLGLVLHTEPRTVSDRKRYTLPRDVKVLGYTIGPPADVWQLAAATELNYPEPPRPSFDSDVDLTVSQLQPWLGYEQYEVNP
jgi:hypothetical protein